MKTKYQQNLLGAALACALAFTATSARATDLAGIVQSAGKPIAGSTVTLFAAGPGAPAQLAQGKTEWLKTEPFTNPSAPLSPILMAEYVLKEMTTAQRNDEDAQQHSLASATAARASNNFVLLTFLFATVLFLGSLANSLPSPTLRNVVSLSALLVFATTFIRLWTLPVAPWK